MDVHPNRHQMDYDDDSAEPKHGKGFPCQEDRFDSGVDSWKEDELASEFENITVSSRGDLAQEYEPWRTAATDDGDT